MFSMLSDGHFGCEQHICLFDIAVFLIGNEDDHVFNILNYFSAFVFCSIRACVENCKEIQRREECTS